MACAFSVSAVVAVRRFRQARRCAKNARRSGANPLGRIDRFAHRAGVVIPLKQFAVLVAMIVPWVFLVVFDRWLRRDR
jgi:hypothetical protein